MRRWKGLLPLLISLALVALLLARVPLDGLLEALQEVPWHLVAAVTWLLCLGSWLWDGVCFWWLFRDRERPLGYGEVLRARGVAYLGSVFHFSAGQGVLVWLLARRQQRPILAAAARTVMVAIVDVVVLLALALAGALASGDPRTEGLVAFCLAGLGGLALATAVLHVIPRRWLLWIEQFRWGAWLADSDLTWRRVGPLYGMRLVYFSMSIAHAAVILWLCGLLVHLSVVISVVPIAAMIDGIPISFSGLGTRDAVLQAFLQPERPAQLLACTLLWWVSMMVGRAAIGLAMLWLPRLWLAGGEPPAWAAVSRHLSQGEE